MRTETADRLKLLEEQYWGKKDAADVSLKIRDKYKSYGTSNKKDEGEDMFDRADETLKAAPSGGILKNGPAPATPGESLAKPKFDYKNLKKGSAATTPGARTRSKSAKKTIEEPLVYNDPRQ